MSISVINSNRGTATEKTSDQTLDLVPNGTLAAGSYAILVVVCDNTSTAEGETTDVSATDDSGGGHTWTRLREQTEANTAALTGVTTAILMARLNVNLTAAHTISIAFAANATAKGAGLMEVTSTGGGLFLAGANGSNAAGANTYSVALAGLPNTEHLYIGVSAVEGETDADVVLDADYTAADMGAIGSGAAGTPISNVRALVGLLTETSTGDTFDASVTALDRATILVALSELTVLSVAASDNEGTNLSDSATVRESLLGLLDDNFPLTLADLLASDLQDVGGSATPLEYAFADDATANLVDSLAAFHRLFAEGSEALSILDTLAASIPITVSVGWADGVIALQADLANLSDNAAAALADFLVASLLEVGEAFPLQYSFGEDASPLLVDALAALQRLLASISDSTGLIDAAIGNLGFKVSASDTVAQVDSLAALERALAAFAENISVAEDISARLPYLAILADNVSAALGDLLVATLIEIGQAFPLSYALDDSVVLSDAVAALERLRALASDSATLIDEAVGRLVLRSLASDSVSLTDQAAALSRSLIALFDALAVSDNVSGRFRYLARVSEDVSSALADLVVHFLVEIGQAFPLSYSFSESLQLTESVAGFFKFFASASDSSVLVDSVVGRLVLLASTPSDATAVTDALVGLERILAPVVDEIALADGFAARTRILASAQESISLAVALLYQILNPGLATPLEFSFSEEAATELLDTLQALTNLLALPADSMQYRELLGGILTPITINRILTLIPTDRTLTLLESDRILEP